MVIVLGLYILNFLKKRYKYVHRFWCHAAIYISDHVPAAPRAGTCVRSPLDEGRIYVMVIFNSLPRILYDPFNKSRLWSISSGFYTRYLLSRYRRRRRRRSFIVSRRYMCPIRFYKLFSPFISLSFVLEYGRLSSSTRNIFCFPPAPWTIHAFLFFVRRPRTLPLTTFPRRTDKPLGHPSRPFRPRQSRTLFYTPKTWNFPLIPKFSFYARRFAAAWQNIVAVARSGNRYQLRRVKRKE